MGYKDRVQALYPSRTLLKEGASCLLLSNLRPCFPSFRSLLCPFFPLFTPQLDLQLTFTLLTNKSRQMALLDRELIMRINWLFITEISRRTVLAGSTAANAAFPGPLITGFKVCF